MDPIPHPKVDSASRTIGTDTAAGPSVVRAEAITKHFRREDRSIVPAVDDVSLEVKPGEFVVLLGPSGCGKTTLLRCIAGLEKPDSGRILIHNETTFDSSLRLNVAPERRHVSMIFQSYALWPHMHAFANVAYPLQARNEPSAEIAARVHEALKLVGIPELAGQFPSQMSGGQQQRVALARAIVSRDDLILFDEPLSNVDAKVREQLRIELLEMQRKLGFAALYVTHDQTEAMALAHRIAVMREGKIAQIGPPRHIYEQPISRYVANFIGTTNELPGRITGPGGGDSVCVATPFGDVLAVSGSPGLRLGDEVVVVFRPERCRLAATEPAGPNTWAGVVEAALFLGSHAEYVLCIRDRSLRIWSSGEALIERGSRAWLSVDSEYLRALPAQDG